MTIDHDPISASVSEAEVEAERRLKAKLENESEVDDIVWLMSSKRGRRIMWRLLDQAGCFRSSFSPNASVTAFNEGGRNGGLRLLDLIHTHCSEQYAPMVKERQRDRD